MTTAPARDAATRLAALRDPAVRDLAWLLFSPDLLKPRHPGAPLADPWESRDEADAAARWLLELDRDPHALHRKLAAARLTRLGFYAEALLGWFLAHGPFARLVAANVVLRRAGRTLGECDFLVETSRGRRLHWELAVKCYLHAGDGRGLLSDFVGPNLRDRFDRKLAHLIDHQLRLSARDEFAVLGYTGPWLAQMFVKGWLFYRAGQQGASTAHEPDELAPDHPRGWWVTHADWPAFAEAQAVDGWSVLPRLDWLAPRWLDGAIAAGDSSRVPAATVETSWRSSGVAAPTDPRALFETLAGATEPVMVAAFSADGSGGCTEISRGFIVPDDWPARAHAFARE
ncbi:DUF1853 family protein [Paraburkholderia caballeronis]|uniref:DUF1853 family protein n=1 Tax=Paraburkholderia caballeronis TaxID=416943 RepID=UPI001066CDDE|nr:DUF1853 family protein [Paraburkholderia caballeronis]TDV20874.1 hypothetical protein C7408_101393 [Paraburkholderia caballeronis]TDV21303.1 hypothetical protein C7406_102203 [Paraburkholderia caballeronis]TDV33342.1 hypothetical protein C7404_101489 [Paraburkholderia caballeronis]